MTALHKVDFALETRRTYTAEMLCLSSPPKCRAFIAICVICYSNTTPPGSRTGCRMSRIRIFSGLQNFFTHSILASISCVSRDADGRRCRSRSGSSAVPRFIGRRYARGTVLRLPLGTCCSASRGIGICTTGSPIRKGSGKVMSQRLG